METDAATLRGAADNGINEKQAKVSPNGSPTVDHPAHEDIGPSHPLWAELAPDDSYVNGVYWADLPFRERISWASKQSNDESWREFKHVAQMFKMDPLSPLSAYTSRYVMGGFGLFTEGYTLFSIGNLQGLFALVWPACWSTFTTCTPNWIAAVTYMQVLGIMVGQVLVGVEGDWVGRRFGLIQDAMVMFLGLLMLTAMWGVDLNGWVICYACSLFVYGIGVGGEYPMTAASSMEHKFIDTRDDKLHRGRNVVLAFLMQGWGQFFNQFVLLILLLIFHGGAAPPYGKVSTQWTFRVQFGIMAFLTLYLAYYRTYKLQYSDHALKKSKKGQRVNQSGYDSQALKLVIRHFPGRLIATAGCWFANDFAFYGNKLFQSNFLAIIVPEAKTNVVIGWYWNLFNIIIELAGYYLAAFLIDHKLYGRKHMQSVGFFSNFLFFFIPAVAYNYLLEPKNLAGFQAIYFLSSFFQQFGPNCTTFLVAGEVYPISVRATAHGFSAACGKLGALVPAIIYNYRTGVTRFKIVCGFGLLGVFLTVFFIPDTTGLDLDESERYWKCVKAGRPQDYHGIAVHPRHLSMFERYVQRRHLAYDPELDRQQKIKEMRAEYEEQQQAIIDEQNGEAPAVNIQSEKVRGFFTNEIYQNQPSRLATDFPVRDGGL